MISAILLSPLIYVPVLLINRYSLPKTVYISAIALICVWHLWQAKSWPFTGILSLYIVGLLLSAKNAVNLVEWWLQISLDLSGIAIFYFVVNFARYEDIDKAINYLKVVSLLLFLSALFPGWFGIEMGLGGGRGGVQGNPSFAAAIEGMGLIAWIYALRRKTNWRGRLVSFSGLTIVIWYLSFLASKATIVGILIGMSFMLLRNHFKTWIVLLLLTILVFSSLPLESLSGRLTLWDATISAWWDFPIFGVGRGNSQFILPLYIHYSTDIVQKDPMGYLYRPFDKMVHNDFLQLLLEAPAALIALIVLLFSLIREGEKKMTFDRSILLAILSVLGSHIFFNFPFELAEQTAIFWLLLGLIYVEKNQPVALTHEHSPFRHF